MSTMNENLTVGERVAWYRRRKGISQEVLAGLVGRTADWLQKAERNRIELDRVSVLRELARVLDVPLSYLLPAPCPSDRTPDVMQTGVAALRAALTDYRQMTPFLEQNVDEKAPLLENIRRDVSAVWSAYQDSRYEYATNRLPTLLADTQCAVRKYSGSNRRQAQGLLALSYHVGAALLTKLCEADLAWVAADRGLAAARETDEPIVIGSLIRSVAHALLSTGRHAEAASLVSSTASYVRASGTSATPNRVSIYGTLLLAGSVAAARMGDRSATRAFLAEADSAAQYIASDQNHMWTSFGPTNVVIHRVATSMELGDTQTAIDLGGKLDTNALPAERRTRHALEVARAFSRRNRREETLAMLLTAERIAPEQVRSHFLSKQLVHALIRTQRGNRDPGLTGLAARLNILP